MYRAVMIESEVVAANGCDIVGLRGVRMRVVLGEEDALAFEVGEMRVTNDFCIVLYQVLPTSLASRSEWRRRGEAIPNGRCVPGSRARSL